MFVEAVVSYIYDRGFVYQFITTLSIYLLINTAFFYRKRYNRYQVFKYYGIPGPKPSLLDGSMRRAYKDNAIFLRDELWAQEYGKIFGFFIGDEPMLIVKDKEKLKKMFFDNNKVFTERSDTFLDSALTSGILFCKNSRWRYMRKVMSVPFSSYTMRGGKSTQFIEDSIRLMSDYIDTRMKEAEHNKVKVGIDIYDLMKSTALYMISELAIKLENTQVKEREENVKSLDDFLAGADKGVVRLAIMFPFLKGVLQFLFVHFEVSKTMALIHKKVNKTIDKKLKRLKESKDLNTNDDKNNNNEQLMDTLVRLHDEGKMSRIEIMGNVEAILFAGYDTTSTTLTYIFWVLAKYPEIQDKLRNDLMYHGVESQYLEQVIKETMRLYPTVMLFTQRLANSTVKIDDELTIPGGTKIMFQAWLMHRDPESWPEPEKFDPERFRPGVEIHPCSYAPFGLSERKCLGYNLAMLEMKMITCDMLLRYRLILKAPQELVLISCAISLSKPRDKVMIELGRL